MIPVESIAKGDWNLLKHSTLALINSHVLLILVALGSLRKSNQKTVLCVGVALSIFNIYLASCNKSP